MNKLDLQMETMFEATSKTKCGHQSQRRFELWFTETIFFARFKPCWLEATYIICANTFLKNNTWL